MVKKYIHVNQHKIRSNKKNGTNEKGEWNYLVDFNRKIKDGPISIFTDGFAIYGSKIK